MNSIINKLTMISTKQPLRSGVALGYQETDATNNQTTSAAPTSEQQISMITNPKALTFPLIVGFVKVGWEGLKMLPVPQLSSIWIPFLLCLFLGMVIAVSNLSEEKPSTAGWLIGLILGAVQCLMLFAAVMGITKDAIGG